MLVICLSLFNQWQILCDYLGFFTVIRLVFCLLGYIWQSVFQIIDCVVVLFLLGDKGISQMVDLVFFQYSVFNLVGKFEKFVIFFISK